MSIRKESTRVAVLLELSYRLCKDLRHEFVMPEHLLRVLIEDETKFSTVLCRFCNAGSLLNRLNKYIAGIETVPGYGPYAAEVSVQLSQIFDYAYSFVERSEADLIDLPHITKGLLNLEESYACYLLKDCLGEKETFFLSELITECEQEGAPLIPKDVEEPNDEPDDFGEFAMDDEESNMPWEKLVTCMNDCYKERNPLIGRTQELERTIQVLCRKDKNNPLHVGEPGVGKTALVWGLVRQIELCKVPKRLLGSRVYQLEMSVLTAGTKFRGELESRVNKIMTGIENSGDNNIVYIDEIHTLVGAGATVDSSLDVSNMLKPFLESGKIRFIGSTTYEEFNKYFSRSKGLMRRFQQIDIQEPSVEEAKNILHQLQPLYEDFHGVKYTDDAINFAVESSAKYITDRYLPDKAIDLLDESGAAMQICQNQHEIDRKDIADVLSKICKVDALSEADEDDYTRLENLSANMLSKIYGQDEAIQQVVEAVQMSRAGLLDDNKPLASLLFVGPTGVGKTEVARVLAKELGIELVRFDMSEYTEKHAVAKLIGSPAGYVGYEDGGLLTDAIRKSPNCVLLLDEIEKAHQDIYNILLQVMDYARLTDNKGRHSDFRNVIIIMTSNAGAQHASKGSVGFVGSMGRGDLMMKEVKHTFKPEFLNRLSGTVVFHDMDNAMATLILKKKLNELEVKLEAKNVKMTLSDEAFGYLLKEGFTPEYGAREMDRVIARHLKPLLMREILFGRLKQGGNALIELVDGSLSVG